jgi:poly(3-hydroxybutyrate) depolymerase
MKKLLLAVLLFAAAIPAYAATPIPSGRWSFIFTDARGWPDRPIRVYTYRGRKCDSSCPILFVMSGEKRNAYDYLAHWELAADRWSFIVVAPEFGNDRWPKAASYNLGGVVDQPNREKWTFSAIEHLFDEVRVDQKGYNIFGHAAGGQFVQRMALLLPDNRANTMVAANPGWFTLPEWRKDKTDNPFPYTLVNSVAGEAEMRKALPRKVILLVGDADNEPDSENLNQSAASKKYGDSRLDRGENFIKAATTNARELGVPLGWELNELPPTAQDAAAMSKIAGELLYKKK